MAQEFHRYDVDDSIHKVWRDWEEWSNRGPIYPLFGRGFGPEGRFVLISTTPWTQDSLAAMIERIRFAYDQEIAELADEIPNFWTEWVHQWPADLPATGMTDAMGQLADTQRGLKDQIRAARGDTGEAVPSVPPAVLPSVDPDLGVALHELSSTYAHSKDRWVVSYLYTADDHVSDRNTVAVTSAEEAVALALDLLHDDNSSDTQFWVYDRKIHTHHCIELKDAEPFTGW